ncbi:hypothetical protein [Phocaeicola sp.]
MSYTIIKHLLSNVMVEYLNASELMSHFPKVCQYKISVKFTANIHLLNVPSIAKGIVKTELTFDSFLGGVSLEEKTDFIHL